MKEFKNKVALITGAANGFGKAFGIEAAKRGMKLSIVDIDGEDLFGTTAVLKKLGAEVLSIEADVTDYEQVKMSIEKTMEAYGQIDVLFCNAGIAPSGDILHLPAIDWEWVAYSNLISHAYYYQEILPIMVKQGTPCHIMATSSIAGIVHGIGNNPGYSATKHGAVALAEDLRAYCEENNYDIGVSVYCPGYVQTDLHHCERHRPERFQNPSDPYYKSQHFIDTLRRVNVNISTGIPIDSVGPRLFKGIEDNQMYILTHQQYLPYIETRHRGIEKDGELSEGTGEGVERDYTGEVALITGAAHGFGFEFAKKAAEKGMKLALVDIHKEKLAEAQAYFDEKGVECISIPTDTSLYDEVVNSVKVTMEKYGKIDVLFNNAGIVPVGDIAHVSLKDFEWAIAVNVLGLAYYYKEVLPIMIEQGTPANIVTTASVAGMLPGIGRNCGYFASKNAAVALTESVMTRVKDMGVANVKISLYCPGYVQTNLHHCDDYRPERFAMGDDPYYKSEYYQKCQKAMENLILTGEPIDTVGDRLFKAMAEGQKYILPHPKYMQKVKTRHAGIENDAKLEATIKL